MSGLGMNLKMDVIPIRIIFYLQFLSELGLLGFILLSITYLLIILHILNFFRKNKQISINNYLIVSIYVAILFPLMPSGNFFNNYLSLFKCSCLCAF